MLEAIAYTLLIINYGLMVANIFVGSYETVLLELVVIILLLFSLWNSNRW